jgi:hypothetical protein
LYFKYLNSREDKMFRKLFWVGVLVILGLSFVLSTTVQAYNKAELDAAERGLQGRKLMSEFISLYKGDPGQLANRKDLLYISYELIRRLEKGEETISAQLKILNQKVTRLSPGTGGKDAVLTSPGTQKEINALSQRVTLLNDRVMRLSSTGVSGDTKGLTSPNVKKEVKSLLPSMLNQSPRIKKMEKEIITLRKNQKSEGKKGKGSDRDVDSQVKTARLIAGTSIAVTLLTVLFMAR